MKAKGSQRGAAAELTDARARRTRQALYAAMLRLLEQKGFDDIQLQEIAAAAGTGRTTFFRHFESKEALLDEIVTDEIDTLVAKSLPLLHPQGLYMSSLALCDYVDQHRPLWRALLSGGAAPRLRARYMERSRQVMAMAAAPQGDLPPELAMSLSTGSLVEVLTWWLKQADALPPADVARLLSKHVLPAFSTATDGWGRTAPGS